MNITGERNLLAKYRYNDIDVVATIDSFSSDYGIHLIRFTRNQLWRYSNEVINFTAYVYFRCSGIQADYGCIYTIDPKQPYKFSKKTVDIEPSMFADTEQRLYNLTDRYKLLFLEN